MIKRVRGALRAVFSFEGKYKVSLVLASISARVLIDAVSPIWHFYAREPA